MGVLVRVLLICLLVLAVPAQGVAAATMAFCGPNQHSGGSPRTEVRATASGHSRHGDALAGLKLDADATADVVGIDDVSTVVKASQATMQTGSACACCCSLCAIVVAVPVIAVPDPVPTVFPTVVSTVDTFATDGPDRPPRGARA